MSKFDFEGREVFYKVFGDKGDPIVLLNGIMTSLVDWKPFVENFSKNNILVLVDFFDQGSSSKTSEGYRQDLQVRLVSQLVQHLGLDKVSLVGVSYGGEVAIRFAVDYSQKVHRLVLVSTAGKTSDRFKKICDQWKKIAKTGDGRSFYLATIPKMYSCSFLEKEGRRMVEREDNFGKYFSRRCVLDSLTRLVDSMYDYDYVDRLGEIVCPTLILSGEEDALIPMEEQRLLREKIKNSTHVTFDGCGHAILYEKPSEFCDLVLGFVNKSD